MNEKVYKTMSGIGGGTLAIGIVVLVTGIVSGTMLIINGARLDRKSTRLNSSHMPKSRMPSSA